MGLIVSVLLIIIITVVVTLSKPGNMDVHCPSPEAIQQRKIRNLENRIRMLEKAFKDTKTE